MRLIDKDALMKVLDIKNDCGDCEYENGFFCSRDSDFVNACEAICDAPTIDAVPVVRCKDCAKREYCRTTNVWATVPDDDWFCADAERRSDDGV